MTLLEVLKILEDSNCWFEDVDDVTFYEELENNEDLLDRKDFDYEGGSSKGVLLFSDCDFVIKVPFIGVHSSVGDGLSLFEYAPDGAQGDNYCLAEKNNYELLKANNSPLLKVFAKTEYIGDFCGVGMYAQEYCESLYAREGVDYSAEELSATSKYAEKRSLYEVSPTWLLDVINLYGLDFVDKLANFIEENQINDLHNGNLGYRKGKPVIFDYSGFWD